MSTFFRLWVVTNAIATTTSPTARKTAKYYNTPNFIFDPSTCFCRRFLSSKSSTYQSLVQRRHHRKNSSHYDYDEYDDDDDDSSTSSTSDEISLYYDDEFDEHLHNLTKKMKLDVIDFDNCIYELDCYDHNKYRLDVIRTNITLSKHNTGLGLVVTEMPIHHGNGKSVIMVREITCNATETNQSSTDITILPGDVITGVFAGDGQQRQEIHERIVGLNYELTSEILQLAERVALETDHIITLELNRLVVLQQQQQQTTITTGFINACGCSR